MSILKEVSRRIKNTTNKERITLFLDVIMFKEEIAEIGGSKDV